MRAESAEQVASNIEEVTTDEVGVGITEEVKALDQRDGGPHQNVHFVLRHVRRPSG